MKGHVYLKILDIISESNPLSEQYKYIDSQSLIHKIEGSEHHSLVTTSAIKKEICFLLRGMGIVVVVIGHDNDLVDIVDISIDPFEQYNEKCFYGIDYLPYVIVNNRLKQNIAEYLQVDESCFCGQLKHNNAEEKLSNIVSLVQKLEWDSDFFGKNIAFISCRRLTDNIENYIKFFVQKEAIDLIEYCCNCHDQQSVEVAERNNYSFVDIRITMEIDLIEASGAMQREGAVVRKAQKKDIDALIECGKGIYYLSRYFYDGNFNIERVQDFYDGWIRKAVLGLFDDYCYALYNNGTLIGFCTINEGANGAASIGLVGVSSEYSGLGWGKYMLMQVHGLLFAEGVHYISVVTQGRNYAAQRLYQRCGYLTKKTELWYHRWAK